MATMTFAQFVATGRDAQAADQHRRHCSALAALLAARDMATDPARAVSRAATEAYIRSNADALIAMGERRRAALQAERDALDEAASFERGLYLGGVTRDPSDMEDAEAALEEWDEENGAELEALTGERR